MARGPRVVRTVTALRRAVAPMRAADATVALVPTMGALHAGHLALVPEARRRAKRVVVSIFVNPTQFAPHEDFGSYPRRFAADLAALAEFKVQQAGRFPFVTHSFGDADLGAMGAFKTTQ